MIIHEFIQLLQHSDIEAVDEKSFTPSITYHFFHIYCLEYNGPKLKILLSDLYLITQHLLFWLRNWNCYCLPGQLMSIHVKNI